MITQALILRTFRLLARSVNAIDLDLCLSSDADEPRETAAISLCN